MTATTVEVPAALDGERVDRVVALLTDASRSEVAALIAGGGVSIAGRQVTKGSQRVAEGEQLSFDGAALAVDDVVLADPSVVVPVVHEDEAVIVIDKPVGLVVHPGAGVPHGTLVNGLLARYPELATVGEAHRPGIVHRLDKETSGLLVVARTAPARDALVEQLSARTVGREYAAVVWGHPDADRGVVDAPIGRSRRHPTRMAVRADGREARTHYEVVERLVEPAELAELRCRLETGRTHQIRVHLAAIGHPVLGDALYGGVKSAHAAPRLGLHATRLSFSHPTTGERLEFVSPPPRLY